MLRLGNPTITVDVPAYTKATRSSYPNGGTWYHIQYLLHVACLPSESLLSGAEVLANSSRVESVSSSTPVLTRLHFLSCSINFARSKSDGQYAALPELLLRCTFYQNIDLNTLCTMSRPLSQGLSLGLLLRGIRAKGGRVSTGRFEVTSRYFVVDVLDM